ncbi:tyrosine-type recombinase/integrase [Clostridium faecium]
MVKRDMYMDKYYLKEYKTYLENLDKSESTVNTYLDNIITFIEWFNVANSDSFQPTTCTTIDLRDYRSHLQTVRNAKANTINLKVMSLKSYFYFLHSYGYIKQDISKNIRKIKTQGPPIVKSIDEQTFRKMRREIYRSGYKHHVALIELLRHALRINEIITLKIDNLHLKEKGSFIMVYGKQGKYRKVPINSDCRNALIDYLEMRQKIKSPYDNLFLSERKAPYTRSGLWKIIDKYSAKIGTHISPHQFRHYAIKKMVDEGVPLTVIANLVGHSSIQLLSDVYAVPLEEDKVAAIEKL